MKHLTLIALALVLALAIGVACGGEDDDGATPVVPRATETAAPATGTIEATAPAVEESSPEPTPNSEPPTPTTEPATPTPGAAVGSTQETPGGNRLTVYSWEAPATGINQFITPDPGNVFIAFDVEACASEALTDPVQINPYYFQLQMPDNTRRQPSYGKDPALNVTTMLAGDCVRGWITYEVPDGVPPTHIIFESINSAGSLILLRWAVAQ